MSDIPCEHGVAAIYMLHKDPDDFVGKWYKKPMFVVAYNHYIEPLNGITQWPVVDRIKPLPPIARRKPGRPKQKRRRDVEEGGNRLIRVGRVMHCQNYKEEGHNKKTCKKEKIVQP